MDSKFIMREKPLDRERRYSNFYCRIMQDNFEVDDIFKSNVQKVLDSGKVQSALEVVGSFNYHQCAYLLQFGAMDSFFSEQKFYESAVKYEKIVRKLSCKNQVNICCLGNQGIFAVIGLCKVIEESVKQFGFSNEDSLCIRIVIVDKNVSWKPLAKIIVAAAQKEFPRLQLKLNYVEGNLSKNYSEEVKSALENSHIVTSVHHFSVMPSAQINLKRNKKTLDHMKKNAILFYLGHDSEQHHIRTLKDFISNDSSFSEIKSSQKPEAREGHKCTSFCRANHCISPSDFLGYRHNYSAIFSTWIKNPRVKTVLQKQEVKQITVSEKPVSTTGIFEAKRSSSRIRNSDAKFKLVGKFACMDMEKKNKDDSKRLKAKITAVSRYANFDDWDAYY